MNSSLLRIEPERFAVIMTNWFVLNSAFHDDGKQLGKKYNLFKSGMCLKYTQGNL